MLFAKLQQLVAELRPTTMDTIATTLFSALNGYWTTVFQDQDGKFGVADKLGIAESVTECSRVFAGGHLAEKAAKFGEQVGGAKLKLQKQRLEGTIKDILSHLLTTTTLRHLLDSVKNMQSTTIPEDALSL